MENKHYLLAFYKEIINLFDINRLKSRDGTSMLSIDELDSYFRVLIGKYLDITYEIDKAIERGELPPGILGEKYV
jgi:hypothetical protein